MHFITKKTMDNYRRHATRWCMHESLYPTLTGENRAEIGRGPCPKWGSTGWLLLDTGDVVNFIPCKNGYKVDIHVQPDCEFIRRCFTWAT